MRKWWNTLSPNEKAAYITVFFGGILSFSIAVYNKPSVQKAAPSSPFSDLITPTATPMPSHSPTATPTPSHSPTATPTPIVLPTATPTPSHSPTAMPTPIVLPTATPTWEMSAQQPRVSDFLIRAKNEAQAIKYDFIRNDDCAAIATLQAHTGDLSGAQKTLEVITEDHAKAVALSAIASAEARAGDKIASEKTFAQAMKKAQPKTDDLGSQAVALRAIASAQAEAGDKIASNKTFILARRAAQSLTGDFTKESALMEVAVAEAQAGNTADALKITFENYPEKEAIVRHAVALAQARAGRMSDAQKTARRIRDDDYGDVTSVTALSDIAIAQARGGDKSASESTLALAEKAIQTIRDESKRISAMIDFAVAQSQVGDKSASEKTFAQALETVQARISSREKPPKRGRIRLDDIDLRNIAIGQVRAGDMQGAEKTARTFTGDDKETYLIAAAVGQAQAGNPTVAETTVQSLDTTERKCEAYIAIANALIKWPPSL